jgi:hypothetical protein
MKLKNTLTRQSPTILAALGCVGFITSVIMSARASPKAMEVLEEMPEDGPVMDKVKAIGPIYAPTVGMILLSTACIIGSNRISRYRYASLLALYSIGEKSLQKWQKAVLDEVSEKKYGNVRERVLTSDKPIPSSIVMDDERVLFFDVYSGRYFRADSVETVRKIVNDLNDQLFVDDFVSLNDFYFEVNLPQVEFGNEAGWNVSNGSIKIDYDAFIKNDKPCVSISFVLKPKKY